MVLSVYSFTGKHIQRINIYNGKRFIPIEVSEGMVAIRLASSLSLQKSLIMKVAKRNAST